MQEKWIKIQGSEYKDALPKEDCRIWITRKCAFDERWVQKIDYCDGCDIEWDGTIAWMPDQEIQPVPYMGDDVVDVQNVR